MRRGQLRGLATGLEALPLAGPLLLLAGLFDRRVFFGHFLESRDRRRLATLFGQYVPPELVDHMSLGPSRNGMQGRNAELSVMFADLRGFTALSETMDPTDLAALINEFLSEMTENVRRRGGTLDTYVGDAAMAFWGAPMPNPLHARLAVEAALAMQAAMPALNRRFTQRGWPSLALGIGINSGPMVVGDLGSRHRRAYTVLGDAVNVAARLQERLCSTRWASCWGPRHGRRCRTGRAARSTPWSCVDAGHRSPSTASMMTSRQPHR